MVLAILELVAIDAGLLSLAILLPIRLLGEGSASAETQAAKTQIAVVRHVSYPAYSDKGCAPCYDTLIVVTGLADAAGDGATLKFDHVVDGPGARPGAAIAVKQDPHDPRHVELVGYPDTPRTRQVFWSIAAVLGLLALGTGHYLLVRAVARKGRFGDRIALLVRPRRPPRARTPFSQLTFRQMFVRVAAYTFGIPIILGAYTSLIVLGATAANINSVSSLPALLNH